MPIMAVKRNAVSVMVGIFYVEAPAAQLVSRWKSGGAAALGSHSGGAGERSETERACAVAYMGIVPGFWLGTLSVTAFSRASSPKGRAKGRALPARRTMKFGTPAPILPISLAFSIPQC